MEAYFQSKSRVDPHRLQYIVQKAAPFSCHNNTNTSFPITGTFFHVADTFFSLQLRVERQVSEESWDSGRQFRKVRPAGRSLLYRPAVRNMKSVPVSAAVLLTLVLLIIISGCTNGAINKGRRVSHKVLKWRKKLTSFNNKNLLKSKFQPPQWRPSLLARFNQVPYNQESFQTPVS